MKQTFTNFLGGALCALFLLMSSTASATITAKWDFKNKIPSGIENTNIQGVGQTGNVASDVEGVQLSILGTSSSINVKFAASYTGETYNKYAQVNNGTVIRVPVVSTNDEVYIHSYYGTDFTIGGEAGASEKTHQATLAEVTAGYVEIIATGTIYPDLISATIAYVPAPTEAKWDFTNHNSVALAVVALSLTSSDTPITANGIAMIANANGKQIGDNTNSIWSYPGLTFKIPVVSTEDIVTVEGFPGYSGYTIDGTEYSETTNYTATAADVSRGYVVVVNGTDTYKYIVSIAVKQKYNVTTATIPASGWGTISSTSPLDFSGTTGVTAYTVSDLSADKATLSSVTKAPASTGLLIGGDAGTYAIPYASSASAVGTNYLHATGAAGAAVAADAAYILNDGVFKKLTVAGTIPANKAYLLASDVPATSRDLDLNIGDDVTGIKNVKVGTEDNIYYDLNGRRVLYPTKGLYIVNGKKVVIK